MVKMDDSEHVCPLCCEELDMSDREFYPCKCGYQVCMWCWHRIRESETGLCPACRTPYGEDPHQFTAMDVEEVLRANKDKEKAKREQQRQTAASDTGGGNDHFNTTAMEVPKDRSQLANMRVIRRNLVYAVGLPPAIANEETLRKPEYFGQYGKIAKIVLNRSQTVTPEGGDPRRASASAYVTFQHKADTLACILGLDGFYMENRNIRASYGTSKYCSAFIKNVRCNNPDCTYLHEMGATEDTFTKQEIQAGYVTSGRDVLARQQQIVAEQLAQQQQSSGGYHSMPRKRVGGGGPSGTGKASAHPVFPPPEYDEPAKHPPSMVPPPTGITRATTTQVTPSAAQQAALLNPATISAKLGRSASVGAASISASAKNAVAGLGNTPPNPHRKSQSGGTTAATTAASVVAGGRSMSKDSSDFPSALTALTPLKRGSVKPPPAAVAKPPPVEEKVPGPTIRNGKKQSARNARAAAAAAANASKPQKSPQATSTSTSSSSSIGGDVIGPHSTNGGAAAAIGGSSFAGGSGSSAAEGSGALASLGGLPISLDRVGGGGSLLGGEVFTGSLAGETNANSSVIGSSLLGGAPLTSTVQSSSASGGGEPVLQGSNPGLWNSSSSGAPGSASFGSSSGVIGSHISSGGGGSNSSSALASILGINLPTGSGSLQESSNLWTSTTQQAPPQQQRPSPLMALNVSSMEQQHQSHQMMGGPPSGANTGSSLIGGVPIGGSSGLNGPGTIGGGNSGGSTKSDIALLQSLLPGVHITSDNSTMGLGGGNPNWTAAPGNQQSFGGSNDLGGSSVGAIGQNSSQQNHQRQGPGIW